MPGKSGWAAVAVVIFDDISSVLLIKRASVPGDPWSGDVAFPGGRFKDGDSDLIATAIRECGEETGIRLTREMYVGVLNVNSPTNAPQIKVLPVAFSASSSLLRELKVDRTEVEEAFLLGIDLSGARQTVIERPCYRGPALEYKGYIIWGMTYRILMELLERLR